MRARLDPSFSMFLLRLGDGTETFVFEDSIVLPPSMILPYEDEHSLDALIKVTFPNVQDNSNCVDFMINRAILTPTNELVDQINETLIELFSSNPIEYKSFDRVMMRVNMCCKRTSLIV